MKKEKNGFNDHQLNFCPSNVSLVSSGASEVANIEEKTNEFADEVTDFKLNFKTIFDVFRNFW